MFVEVPRTWICFEMQIQTSKTYILPNSGYGLMVLYHVYKVKNHLKQIQ